MLILTNRACLSAPRATPEQGRAVGPQLAESQALQIQGSCLQCSVRAPKPSQPASGLRGSDAAGGGRRGLRVVGARVAHAVVGRRVAGVERVGDRALAGRGAAGRERARAVGGHGALRSGARRHHEAPCGH